MYEKVVEILHAETPVLCKIFIFYVACLLGILSFTWLRVTNYEDQPFYTVI